ncbi:MAG: hypothetical protein DME69_08725 [Verrucomicrobia bacterium]|nr:MAG: hypothetical protein AUH91_02745 [Verrucomicrobia bacterium 13_1_40CM_4_54_4]PYJ78395.1 MAG: hypothetical protein DME69_08725 [Verrucomicrobiota bacterium]
MSASAEIQTGHPLFKELRNGMLWHSTGAQHYRRIWTDRVIKPNDGRIDRWGKPYACQQLGAVSLFDFTTEPEYKVLDEAFKWQQFLGDYEPVTLLLGIERKKLQGKLIPYPENKEGTAGPVIPWVEVCHCGPIPASAIVTYLLVCPTDYRCFKKFQSLNEEKLSLVEKEFGPIVETERKRQMAEHRERVRRLLDRAHEKS